MIYRDFKGTKLSLLGFGTMRLPVLENGQIDAALTQKMVDYAMAHGVNYYDTAWPYMQNRSETVVGQCLKKHPRDSFYLATKFPGHMVAETYDPADIFEQQLQKCQVEYFDFYLLHNVYENSVHVYDDPRWGIVDYFVEQKKQGRIKHLGFSSHADLPCLTDFLNRYGDEMEFCQLQFNYLDWTLQHGKEKYELLRQRNIPLWVMEPVRGGKLVTLEPDEEQRLHAIRPDDSLLRLPLVTGLRQHRHGAVRHVQHGPDGRQYQDLRSSESPVRRRAGYSDGRRRAHEECHPLHRLPLLLRRLPPGIGYPRPAA